MSPDEPSLNRRTLLALLDASQALISEPALDQVLQRVAEQAAAVLEAEGASVLLLDARANKLVFHAATGPKDDTLVGERFDAALGIAGQAVKTRRAVRVDDVRQNRHFFAGFDAQTQMQTRGIMAAPLIHLDSVVGVVEVLNPRGRERFDDGDLELLRLFGNLAAVAVHRGQDYDRVRRHNLGLRQAQPSAQIIGQSAAIGRTIDLCHRVAPSNATVLICGETGTGKELVARAIHDLSARSDQPFIAINCAALPETLLESELFGHEQGAFTGAVARKLGRFELAEGGTVFLDELGEMAPALQVKLLRVLQEREFVRVGGTTTITCDARVVAATNRDLQDEMEAGRFREDLFYRLNVFPIQVPPLRDRIEDLPLLVAHFIGEVVPSLGVERPEIDDQAIAALCRYDWPGNVRELRNIIERCALLASDGRITVGDLPPEIAAAAGDAPPTEPSGGGSKLAGQERALILKALTDTGWNRSAAARQLGVSRDHLRYRITKYGLRSPGG